MARFCLVDWVVKDGAGVVPWMTFDTLDALMEVRRMAHPSWPTHVACIGIEPSGQTRHDRNRSGKANVFMPIGPVTPFYDIDTNSPPLAWREV